MKEIVKQQKITGREEGFILAPRSGFIQTCSKKKSGDKSLFPTCDFLRSKAEFTLWPSQLRRPNSSAPP